MGYPYNCFLYCPVCLILKLFQHTVGLYIFALLNYCGKKVVYLKRARNQPKMLVGKHPCFVPYLRSLFDLNKYQHKSSDRLATDI